MFISLCINIFYLALRLQHYAAVFESGCDAVCGIWTPWKTDFLAVMSVLRLALRWAEANPEGN